MDYQLLAVVVCVTLALAYLLRRGWRTWMNSQPSGCHGCSCAGPKQDSSQPGQNGDTFIPLEDVNLRAISRR
jgi:hypothetical protein